MPQPGNSQEVPQMVKQLPFDPVILLSGTQDKLKYIPHKNLFVNAHSSIINNGQKI